LLQGCLIYRHSALDAESMVRQAHHDKCYPEPVEGWIPAYAGMTTFLNRFIIINEVSLQATIH